MTPCRIVSLLALGAATIVALAACGSQTVRQETAPMTPMYANATLGQMATATPGTPADLGAQHEIEVAPTESGSSFVASSEMINAVAPPCIPYPGSNIDPCETRDYWEIGVHGSYSYRSFPDRPFDTYQHMKKLSERCPNGFCTPQFYVRATVVPGSARCALTGAMVLQNDNGIIDAVWKANPGAEYGPLACFVDIDVHEYLNGSGPQRMPIILRTIYVDFQISTEEMAARARGASLDYEGYEFIIPLTRDVNLAHGEWSKVPEGLWDVQRDEDGEVIVVSWWASLGRPEWRSDYVMTLDDFREMTREGMARYFRETGGRLGTAGKNPMAATDASRDGLLGMLRELGAFNVGDVTPVSAPPAPGEGGLFAPRQETIAPTATATPQVTDFATPTTTLDNAPTATADPLP